ncbi:indolethylamine N-methyltransferase-like [Leptodactylus fuscus]|uniref:indolethylamine N-methyltransferase-like n=1 Tax=Leptodactylus fuscus TaxID=238119 RepID=UPI003F4F3290
MDPVSYNHYDLDEFDPKELLTTYCHPGCDETLYEEMTLFPMRTLQLLVAEGKISGTTLIDFSTGPIIFPLLALSDHFSDIILLKPNYFCIVEVEKWQNGEEESFDWSHLSEYFTKLEDDRNKIKEEESLKKNIKYIMRCDMKKENPTSPFVLPKADCLTTFYLLQNVSKDKETFYENLKKISSLLRVGGRLLLVGLFNAKRFTIGGDKFHFLTFDEDFLRKTLTEAGFIIESLEKIDSKVTSGIAKYDQVYFACALKIREV